ELQNPGPRRILRRPHPRLNIAPAFLPAVARRLALARCRVHRVASTLIDPLVIHSGRAALQGRVSAPQQTPGFSPCASSLVLTSNAGPLHAFSAKLLFLGATSMPRFSRRSFLHLTTAASAATALRYMTEPMFAAAARRRPHAPDAVMIDSNENPLGPCQSARDAMAAILPQGGRYSDNLTDDLV